MLGLFMATSLNWAWLAQRRRNEAAERERSRLAQIAAAAAAKKAAIAKKAADAIAAEKARKERINESKEKALASKGIQSRRRVGDIKSKKVTKKVITQSYQRDKAEKAKVAREDVQTRQKYDLYFVLGDRVLPKKDYSRVETSTGFNLVSKEQQYLQSRHSRRGPDDKTYANYVPHVLEFDKDGRLIQEVYNQIYKSNQSKHNISRSPFSAKIIKYTDYGKQEILNRDVDENIRHYQTNYYNYDNQYLGRDEGNYREARDKMRSRERYDSGLEKYKEKYSGGGSSNELIEQRYIADLNRNLNFQQPTKTSFDTNKAVSNKAVSNMVNLNVKDSPKKQDNTILSTSKNSSAEAYFSSKNKGTFDKGIFGSTGTNAIKNIEGNMFKKRNTQPTLNFGGDNIKTNFSLPTALKQQVNKNNGGTKTNMGFNSMFNGNSKNIVNNFSGNKTVDMSKKIKGDKSTFLKM